ncbi:MAG: hypothetical protein GY769_04040, partial [bacterium]|nr:hypothetical protein [bacterium]
MNRLEEVRQIRVGHVLLDRVPPSRVKALERYAAAAWDGAEHRVEAALLAVDVGAEAADLGNRVGEVELQVL